MAASHLSCVIGAVGMLHTAGISKSTDRIAIIGIGCSFPGGVESPDSLWRFLRRGGDAVVEVPADRWNVDAVYDPMPGTPGMLSTVSPISASTSPMRSGGTPHFF